MTVTINGTTGISGVDGSSATPAVQGVDTNTGIFYGTDIVGVSTGGSERMRVDASGNVGIGTSSPNYKLDIAGSANSVAFGTTLAYGVSGEVYSAFRFNNSSFSGGNSEIRNIVNGAASTGSALSFLTTQTGSGPLTERMRIDSSGNLLVGTTGTIASGYSIQAYGFGGGAIAAKVNVNGNNAIAFFNASGTQVGTITANAATTSYNTSSDYRLKENIQPMQNALATVAQLNPVTYTWKADGSDGQGFIAHELQAVVPDCVTGEKDAVDAEGNPVYQGIDTSFLVATLTKAIQELSAKNDALEARLAALEAK